MPKSRDRCQLREQGGVTLLFLPAKAFMQRILFDPVFWAELEQKLFSYYFEHFIKFASAKLFN